MVFEIFITSYNLHKCGKGLLFFKNSMTLHIFRNPVTTPQHSPLSFSVYITIPVLNPINAFSPPSKPAVHHSFIGPMFLVGIPPKNRSFFNIYVFNFYIFHISFKKKKIHHSQESLKKKSFLCVSLHIARLIMTTS